MPCEPVTVETEAGQAAAQVYPAARTLWQPGAPWDLADWARAWGEITTRAAQEVMVSFRH